MCFFQLFSSHDYVFSSPQNRFKGPKAVRLKPNRNSRSERKNSVTRKGNWISLVAEMGFEPHDLRVMSPTSCQTAPLRDIMVPEAGVEPVREKISRDFKSRASANSAIPAFATVICFTLPIYYSINNHNCQYPTPHFVKNFFRTYWQTRKIMISYTSYTVQCMLVSSLLCEADSWNVFHEPLKLNTIIIAFIALW